MMLLSIIIGVVLILGVLWDAFETIILPRRVTRRFRLTSLFYRYTWRFWSASAHSLFSGKRQETYLGFFGPLSLFLLLGIWAAGLITGFALLNWGGGVPIKTPEETAFFGSYLYLSGTTFFTLGLGDVTPVTAFGRALAVIEAGLGFGFLAIVISYLPALNQSFSRREVNISLLDARAGSPSTAAEMLRRHSGPGGTEALLKVLGEWERWSAELLESHLSYPVLAYFRSQHENQSWLAALTTILDTSALAMAGITESSCVRQARLTFAIARHAVVDLALVFGTPPNERRNERLPASKLAYLLDTLSAEGMNLHGAESAGQRLEELRRMYEPYIYSLSAYLLLPVPPFISESAPTDNWRTSAWEPGTGLRKGGGIRAGKEHF